MRGQVAAGDAHVLEQPNTTVAMHVRVEPVRHSVPIGVLVHGQQKHTVGGVLLRGHVGEFHVVSHAVAVQVAVRQAVAVGVLGVQQEFARLLHVVVDPVAIGVDPAHVGVTLESGCIGLFRPGRQVRPPNHRPRAGNRRHGVVGSELVAARQIRHVIA